MTVRYRRTRKPDDLANFEWGLRRYKSRPQLLTRLTGLPYLPHGFEEFLDLLVGLGGSGTDKFLGELVTQVHIMVNP